MISDGEKKTSDVSWLETYSFRKYVTIIFSRVKVTGRFLACVFLRKTPKVLQWEEHV